MSLTVADFDTPIERAEHIAAEIELTLGTFPTAEPDELIDRTLGILFLAQNDAGEQVECLLVRDDANSDDRAAAIIFCCSLLAVTRDTEDGPAMWERLRCRLDDDDERANFIAFERSRLPEPAEAGYGKLAALMGKSAGLDQPAVFGVIGAA